MAEQLSMDFATQQTNLIDAEQEAYEPLDKQLASLFQELNGLQESNKKQNKILKACTLEISKHTREGQIAIVCSDQHQSELLKTNVVAEAGDEANNYKPLILDKGYLYLRRYWQYQQQLAEQIQSRMKQIDEPVFENKAERLKHNFKDDIEVGETNWQQIAAERALSQQFLILSGGPGTGKTTTITRILALLIEQHLSEAKQTDVSKPSKRWGGVLSFGSAQDKLRSGNGHPDIFNILLAAPTGKAAIRMLDSIRDAQSKLDLPEEVLHQMPNEASTIHKLLGYQHGSVKFKHNHHNPLNADVVMVDEASMIDIALMSKLVEAVPPNAKLILIGDKDQLSSVETGSVFADMCEGLSNPLSTSTGRGEKDKTRSGDSSHLVTLQKNWRFSEDSDIGQLAIAANQGDSTSLLSVLKDENRVACELIAPEKMRDADLIKPWENYFKVLNNPESTHAEIFQAFNQYRVLCALRRGLNGSTIMNSRIETALAKQGLIKLKNKYSNQQSQSWSSNWYSGRPVMITQNSYSKGLFNGDTGITLIRDGEVKVFFPTADSSFPSEQGQFKSFAPVRLPAHETTWAMTIHKSQGSEFDQVVLILPHEEMPLLTRQLIYTGITRARQEVDIVASEGVLVAGVKAEVISATRISSMFEIEN